MPVLTASRQQWWNALLPTGTASYWTRAKLIITRGEIAGEIILCSTHCFIYCFAGVAVSTPASECFNFAEVPAGSSICANLCSSNMPERNQCNSRARLPPTNINNYFSFTLLSTNYEKTATSWTESIGPWRRRGGGCFFSVQENNENRQITNFAGLCGVI